jgi:hypothetical protein
MIHALLAPLEPFHPLIAGTFPLGLYTRSSDLDVLCEAQDLARFDEVVRSAFGHLEGFTLTRTALTPPASIARFSLHRTPVEVFAQPLPVYAQHAFRHLVVEGRLLRLGGAPLRERVQALKQRGIATEPAFAQVLKLEGDPFDAVLKLEHESDAALRERLAQGR